MAEVGLPLLFLAGSYDVHSFTSPNHGPRPSRNSPKDRAAHGQYLRRQFDDAWKNAKAQAVSHGTRHGVYIEFVSVPGFELKLTSLDLRRSGIHLCNVRTSGEGDSALMHATVYIPMDKRSHFLRRIQDYEADAASDRPKNEALIANISDIRGCVLESFWFGLKESIPEEAPDWIEVWLSTNDENHIGRFSDLCVQIGIEILDAVLIFPERTVIVVSANRSQLESLIACSDDIAELRAASAVATEFVEMSNAEQAILAQNLKKRMKLQFDTDVSVAILDTGINNGHLLLRPMLSNLDCHAVNPSWGVYDDGGHGTLMAGTAVFGDLLDCIQSRDPIIINHRLESVKILPKTRNTERDLWGSVTAQGVYRTEIQAPNRRRVFCLAITSTDFRDRGMPTSWSSALDQLASDVSCNERRLIIVCAGNADMDGFNDYPISNYSDTIHDPAQAWNALTVGAYTRKIKISTPAYSGYSALAPQGGLSPFSTTSLNFEKSWPIKPEVLFEGGNLAKGPNDSIEATDDLMLLSTYHDTTTAHFASFEATSAAAAQAAKLAAEIRAAYPQAWPETVRGLIIHSAEWTDAMKAMVFGTNQTAPNKSDYRNLLRICGYGVPDAFRARYCASNALTLIAQEQIQPFKEVHNEKGKSKKTNEMHVFRLPWPSDILKDLGEVPVSMRITLSYFIEPGPGNVGWKERYRYPSHGLRFAVNGPGEDEREFRSRINRNDRDGDAYTTTEGATNHWLLGENSRNVGSVHSDVWLGRAADLAASNLVAVYPAIGWWRERHHLGHVNDVTRYSLIVSVDTPEGKIDIYTPVANQIRVPTPILVKTPRLDP
jgi:hypothetical protein